MREVEEIFHQFLRAVSDYSLRVHGTTSSSLTRNELHQLYREKISTKLSFSELMDELFFHGLMDARIKSGLSYNNFFVTDLGLAFVRDPSSLNSSLENGLLPLQVKVDSADWTGLGKKVSPDHAKIIRSKANELLAAIIQSDADEVTRLDACKRVEAVICLLDAPNTPWREVAMLLSHPAVTAFFAAISLLQFLVGLC